MSAVSGNALGDVLAESMAELNKHSHTAYAARVQHSAYRVLPPPVPTLAGRLDAIVTRLREALADPYVDHDAARKLAMRELGEVGANGGTATFVPAGAVATANGWASLWLGDLHRLRSAGRRWHWVHDWWSRGHHGRPSRLRSPRIWRRPSDD